jgi:hypothetical protein
MVKANLKTKVVERNIRLTGNIMQYLVSHPEIFNTLPDKFELVVLPEDDYEIRQYNLDLLDKYGSEGKPIVFARIKSKSATKPITPSLFVPVAA